jgi:hypothetical protein
MHETTGTDRRLGSSGAVRYALLRMRRYAVVGGLVLAFWACGGSVDVDGSGGSSGKAGAGGVSAGGTGGAKDGGKAANDAGKDAKSDAQGGSAGYVDPGCPDASPPPPDYQCNPFGEPTGCGFGEGCYPWVDYPTGPCDFEEFGTLCAPAGFGQQGDPCTGLCAAFHVCVITGQGTQCVQICKLDGPNDCPAGLVCVPVDVEGIGGCW